MTNQVEDVCLGCYNIIPQTGCFVHNSDGGWEGKGQGISMVKVRFSTYEFWGDTNIQTIVKEQHLASNSSNPVSMSEVTVKTKIAHPQDTALGNGTGVLILISMDLLLWAIINLFIGLACFIEVFLCMCQGGCLFVFVLVFVFQFAGESIITNIVLSVFLFVQQPEGLKHF